MSGKYHFECLNPSCKWGTEIEADNENDAIDFAFRKHDERWINMAKNNPGNFQFCPGRHFIITSPEGKISRF